MPESFQQITCCHPSPPRATRNTSQEKMSVDTAFPSGFSAPWTSLQMEGFRSHSSLLYLIEECKDAKEVVMGVFWLYRGSEKKPGTTQASSSGTKDGCAINQERKAELLPAEPEPPHHTPFQLGFHFPDISCLNISCLYRLKEWSCGISNIAFLLHTYLSPAKSFLITWKLTHLSKSQILRGEVCPQQAVPVTNELFKNKTNKNTY